jgi:hypothetical protein
VSDNWAEWLEQGHQRLVGQLAEAVDIEVGLAARLVDLSGKCACT